LWTGIGADDGGERCRGIVRRAENETGSSILESLECLLVGGAHYDQPRTSAALLSGIAESRHEHAADRLIEVGVVVDDDRVLATHLRDHPLDVALARVGLCCRFDDSQPDRTAPGERDVVDPRMLYQHAADVATRARQV